MAKRSFDTKLYNGKGIYTVKNGEEQGDNNSADDFNRQLCVMCEVRVTNTDVCRSTCIHMVLQFSQKNRQ